MNRSPSRNPTWSNLPGMMRIIDVSTCRPSLAKLVERFTVTRSLTRLQAVLLGSAIILGIVLGSLGLFAIGSRQWLWSNTFHLNAGFRQINGVETGTRVRVLGRDAGEVEKILLPELPSGEIVLVLRLDDRVRSLVRTDAVAQIVPEGMVGGRVVAIQPGTDAASSAQDDAQLATQPTAELYDLLAKVNHAARHRDGNGSLGKLVRMKKRITKRSNSHARP